MNEGLGFFVLKSFVIVFVCLFLFSFFSKSHLKPNSLLGEEHNKIDFKAWRESTEV